MGSMIKQFEQLRCWPSD